MVERLRTIRDGLVCGCTPAELLADVEAAPAEAEMWHQFPMRIVQGIEP